MLKHNSQLSINECVSTIAQTCYFELRRLASICRFLTRTATATHVSTFVLSRIVYCNSLLFGSTHDVTSHLQRIHNNAAQVILCISKSSNITIHLKSLYLLPVKVRSTYKIACCVSPLTQQYCTIICHWHAAEKVITHPQHSLQLTHHTSSQQTFTQKGNTWWLLIFFFFCLELYSKWCQVCPITVII